MKWGAPSVAHFAREAGFTPPELHTATAIALAASNGIDNYDVHTGFHGAGRYVGLWGVNVHEWPQYGVTELTRPEAAAQAAYELTRRSAGFGWSAVWRANSDLRHLAVASEAHSRLPFGEIEHQAIQVHVAKHVLHAMEHRLRGKYARGRHIQGDRDHAGDVL